MAEPIGALRADLSANVVQFSQDMGRAARAARQATSRMENNFDRLSRSANQSSVAVTRATSNLSTSLTKVGALMGVTLGGAAIVGGIRRVIDATIEQENQVRQIEQALIATEGAAGLTTKELVAMAGQFQKTTTFGDEAVLKVSRALLSFRNIGKEVFEPTLAAILDFSTATGRDAAQAARTLGLAINDPIAGLGRLSQAGVALTASQKELIKEMAESGDLLGAQRMLLDELEKSYGGAAQAARNTMGGAVTALGNAWGDLFEAQQGATGPAIDAINELTDLLQDQKTIEGAQQITAGILNILAALIRLASYLPDFAKAWDESLIGRFSAFTRDLRSQGIDLLVDQFRELQPSPDIGPGRIPIRARPAVPQLPAIGGTGAAEATEEIGNAAQRAADKLNSFIETQARQLDHLQLTAEAMGRGQAAVDGLNHAIEIQDALIRTGLIPANTDLKTAMELAATSEDQRVRSVANLVTRMQEAKAAIDSLTAAEKAREEQKALNEASSANFANNMQRLNAAIATDADRAAASQDRLRESLFSMDRIAAQAGYTLSSSLTTAIMAGDSLKDTFANIISSLAEMVLQALLFQAIMSSIGAGGFGPFKGLFGAKGLVMDHGSVTPMAKGGLITGPTLFPLRNGAAIAGEAGIEAIMPLVRDRQGRLGVHASGGGASGVQVSMPVTIINNTDAEVTKERRTNAGGQEELIVMVERQLAAQVGRGEGRLARAIQRNFGLNHNPVNK